MCPYPHPYTLESLAKIVPGNHGWGHTAQRVAIAVAIGVTTDMGPCAENVAFDPKRTSSGRFAAPRRGHFQ